MRIVQRARAGLAMRTAIAAPAVLACFAGGCAMSRATNGTTGAAAELRQIFADEWEFRLREAIEEGRFGSAPMPDTNSGDFHELVLGCGALPLGVLESKVLEWIADR